MEGKGRREEGEEGVTPTTYTWGKNKDGELGINSTKDVSLPRPCKSLGNRNIIHVSSGGQHSSAIDSTGRLSTCGSYLHGKLGIEDLSTVAVLVFTPVTSLKDRVVKQVACGDYHTLCLLEDGNVYTWGGTLHKKLGQRGSQDISRLGLVSTFVGKNVVYVDCGDFHSVALTADGRLYSWGGGGSFFNRGQCGHGHTNDLETPEPLEFFKGTAVKQVSCGGYHTLALTDRQEVYAWGSGLYGECGFGEFLNTATPKLVLTPWIKKASEDRYGQICAVSGGGHHSLLLTNQGFVLSFGFGSHGQLGLRNTANQGEPVVVKDLRRKPVKQIAAGWNHSLVLTQAGDVFACGYGYFGQLGLGDEESKTSFTHVAALGAKKVERIYAGGNHSWALLDPAQPIRRDYEPPSPLPSESGTPSLSRSPSPSLRATADLDVPSMRLTDTRDYALQIAYTDLRCCHRFVRFSLREDSLDEGKEKAEEFVHDVYLAEAGVQYHRIQEDDDIVEQTSEGSRVVSAGHGLSFTCMLVCDPAKSDPPAQWTELTTEPAKANVIIRSRDLAATPQQAALSEWVRLFMSKVAGYCSRVPKFFELRPYGYYV